jgi:hypothetical protein
MNNLYDNFLAHYGILGMHWGVRTKSEGASGGSSRPAGKRASDMTDAELKERIARISLERQYRDLTRKELSVGQKFLNDVLTGAGKEVAT